jgi:heme-degrading monooxygenase HmoA
MSYSETPEVLEVGIKDQNLTRDNLMFIAMNRFKIVPGHEVEFEKLWRERDSHLKGVKGFESFNLIRGPRAEYYTLYASHTVWHSKDCFEKWTKSSAFRKAHKISGKNSNLYLAHPIFEGFDVVF